MQRVELCSVDGGRECESTVAVSMKPVDNYENVVDSVDVLVARDPFISPGEATLTQVRGFCRDCHGRVPNRPPGLPQRSAFGRARLPEHRLDRSLR